MRYLLLLSLTLLLSCHSKKLNYDLNDPAQALDTIAHRGYTLLYSERHEQALWVEYVLTQEETEAPLKRKDSFKQDPHVPHGSASNSDYKRSGYDKGHLKPANDSKASEDEMAASFYLSNMSPQLPNFNRKIWKELEREVHNWAKKQDSIHIVTGPIFERRGKTIGDNDVAIPSAYYKVILSADSLQSIGFILLHKASDEPLNTFALTVDSVEAVTGFDFFKGVDERVEASYDYESWN